MPAKKRLRRKSNYKLAGALAMFACFSMTGFSALALSQLHYAANPSGDMGVLAGLGFNLMDVTANISNPKSVNDIVNALPANSKALIWIGNIGKGHEKERCPAPGYTDAQFQDQVDALADNPRVFGYYIADEPRPSICPNAAQDIRARSDYIHAHAPKQKSFMIVLDGSAMCPKGLGCEFRALSPANTHVDLIGIDPYPCHVDSQGIPSACDMGSITERVNAALQNGIPGSAIVPVFQEFGQEGRADNEKGFYLTPKPAELATMLKIWGKLVPNPVFDYAYTWGIQCTQAFCPSPQALKNHSELQSVVRQYNQGNFP